MKKTKKTLLCGILAALMLLQMLAVVPFASAADKTEIPVVWNSGYVGSETHSTYKNKLSGSSATYKYSDVIVVEKAGTKISFTDTSAVGDSGTKYASNTVYVFSSWKQSGSSYVIDLDGANVMGTYQYESVGQRRAGKTEDDGMIYEYVTDRDGEAIRLCYRCTASDTETPKVYMESTTEQSTLKTMRAGIGKAVLADNGTVTGLGWYVGYLGSAANTNGSAGGIRWTSASYTISDILIIPKAGTRITFTLSCTPNANYNAISRYTLNAAGTYVYKDGFSANDAMIRTGSNPYTYSYVTGQDNEAIRIGLRSGQDCSATGKVALDTEPVKVTWKYTGEAGTGTVELKTEWPDAEALSLLTGAPLVGTEVQGIKWLHGYIGSQYQDDTSKRFVYLSPSNVYYYTSSVITVPKAGTRVVFFDQTFTDFGGGNAASFAVLTLSHWNKAGTVLDRKKPYLTGCEVKNILLTDEYFVYEYTTTEDNEMIRLCLRYAPMYESETMGLIPPVYLVEQSDFTARTESKGAVLTEDSYTDASGEKFSFSYYLPRSYDPAKRYSLVFDASADGATAVSLATRGVSDTIVIAANGDSAKVLRLLDEVLQAYPVRVSDILIAGGDEMAAHAAKYENIRLAQAFLYTGSTKAPSLKYADVKNASDFASADEAANWLIGKTDDYFPVLEGLKMYAIGDSYFGGAGLGQHQTWVNLIGYQYGMTFHNFGLGGDTVAVNPSIDANHPPMAVRYTELPTDGDIYFIEGGRNDRHFNVPFGKNTDTVNNTFKGALNIIISYIRSKNPDALIVLVTPWSYVSETGYLGTNNKYADAMKELAEYINDSHVVCLYAADAKFTGIEMSNSQIRAKYCLASNDVSHLNADGMYMIKDKFEEWVAGQYAALRGVELLNTATDGHDRFDKAQAEETTAGTEEQSTAGAPETTAPEKNGGCGSAVASLGAIAAALALCVVTRRRKTREAPGGDWCSRTREAPGGDSRSRTREAPGGDSRSRGREAPAGDRGSRPGGGSAA